MWICLDKVKKCGGKKKKLKGKFIQPNNCLMKFSDI